MAQRKYNQEMCTKAIEVLKGGESLAAVCCELGIGRRTLYEWRDKYPEFADALEIGLQYAQRVWEQIGRDGMIGNYEKFNGAPWIFTMKNRFRADYAEEKESKSDAVSIVEKILDKLID